MIHLDASPAQSLQISTRKTGWRWRADIVTELDELPLPAPYDKQVVAHGSDTELQDRTIKLLEELNGCLKPLNPKRIALSASPDGIDLLVACRNLFEPDIVKKRLDDGSQLEAAIRDFCTVLDLVDLLRELNLETM